MSTKGPFGIEIDGSTTNKVWNANSTTANKTAYGDEDAYEAAVGEQLALIHKSQVGLIILILFQNIGYKLTVVPYTDLDSYHQNVRCFFFQAEDGIRDLTVTGVQTCALPILLLIRASLVRTGSRHRSRRWPQ